MADIPSLDRASLESDYSNYQGPSAPAPLPNVPYTSLSSPIPDVKQDELSSLASIERNLLRRDEGDGRLTGGGIPRTLAEASSDRYKNFVPGEYNNEDAYGQSQTWVSKMVSGVGKGLLLTGTTFLQSTAGMLNGAAQAWSDGRFASFYDNDFNRRLDELNKKAEDYLPNYYTDEERDRNWYAPAKIFSANFFWDGIIKNLGFSAGAAMAGGVYASGIKALASIPGLAKLLSVGKQAEALAATEAKLLTGAAKGAETYGKVKGLSDKFLGSWSALNPGGRAVVAGLATSGEAGFEAFQNLNQFRDEKIAEYKQSHLGQDPIGEDLEKINAEAENVGNWSFGLNTALLSATNYIQFPKILGSSYTAEKGTINTLTHETHEIVEEGGKYVEKKGIKNKLGDLLWNKVRPYTFSASEGFEEGAQFAITKGTQDYYNKKYNGVTADFLDSLVEGVSTTLTTNEGMENVLIGGLSGSLMLARGRFRQGRALDVSTQEALRDGRWGKTGLNTARLSDFTKDTMDSVNRGTELQQEREQLLKEGNISESKDIEADYIINYLSPRIKHGRYDLVRSEIDTYRQLANGDFAQLQAEGKALPTDTKEAYLRRLDNLERTADNVKSLYQSLHLRFGAQVDDNNKMLYTPEVMDKMVYAASKVADYDVRIPQLKNKLLAGGVDATEIINNILEGKNDLYDAAVAKLVASKELNSDELAQDLRDVAKLSIKRDKFLDEFADIKTNPKKYQEVRVEPTVAPSTKEATKTVKVVTKVGDKDLEVGTPYYVGQAVKFDQENLNEYVSISQLTILKENADGTLEIQDHNGKVQTIKKDSLAEYKLGKVDDLKKNDTANFFYHNRNKKYKVHFGPKYGGTREGRLEYDNDQLFFVYKNSKGKLDRYPISRKDFIAKQGFTEGKISEIGEVKPLSAKEKEARDKFLAAKAVKEEAETLARTREKRMVVVRKIEEETRESLEESKKKIDKQQAALDNILEDIARVEKAISEGREGKRVKLKAGTTIKVSTESLNRLSAINKNAEIELASLIGEYDDLQMDLMFFEDFAQNLDELPENTGEFLKELNNQIEWVGSLADDTEKQIDSLIDMVKTIEGAIKDVVKLLRDVVQKQDPEYPLELREVFTALRAGEDIEGNLLKLKALIGDYVLTKEMSEEFALNEEYLAETKAKIKEVAADLTKIEAEYKAKKAVYDRFNKIMEAHKEQEAIEKRMGKDQKMIAAALGTAYKDGPPIVHYKTKYEAIAKKATDILMRATMGIFRGKSHQERANRFGVNMNKFKNKDDIRGVYITAANQHLLFGDKSLVEHLAKDEKGDVDPKVVQATTIALVMVQDINGIPTLVDVKGRPLTEGADKLNEAIYQVFPLEDLMWDEAYGKTEKDRTMFRSEVNIDEQKDLRAQYKKWRDDLLANPPSPAVMHEIKASFGRPQEVKDESGNTVYTTRTSIEDAGLIDHPEGDVNSYLQGNAVISIPKTNDVLAKDTVAFTTPLGRVFLETPNGYVKLQNRQHTASEADTIFQVLHQLAVNMLPGGPGIKDDKSVVLYEWLKSVVYWGVPKTESGQEKDHGYNSVFWKKDEKEERFVLYLSGKGKSYTFTPKSLEDNKEEIVKILGEMYNNTNSAKAKDLKKAYYQIIGIDAKGEPIFATEEPWQNYQTYLLSKTTPDGKTRSGEEIPLTTMLRPLKDEDDVNRTDVYFYTTDNSDQFIIPKIKKQTAPAEKPKPAIIPGTPTVPEKEVKHDYDGKKQLVFTSQSGLQANYTAVVGNSPATITLRPGKDLDEMKKKLAEVYPGEDADALIRGAIWNEVGPEIVKLMKPAAKPKASAAAQEMSIQDKLMAQANSTVAENEPTVEEMEDYVAQLNNKMKQGKKQGLRKIIKDEIEGFVQEDWNKVESFLKKVLPNFPIYRLKNLLQATNGMQAYGMFQDAALYVWKNAEVGTVYHEVFHAVWRMISTKEEQAAVLTEMRSRDGMFFDRTSETNIKYADATDLQLEEYLAEEFRNYVQDNKIPAKPKTGRAWIVKLFADLVTMIKKLFLGGKAQMTSEELFKNITKGKYKSFIPYTSEMSLAKRGVIDEMEDVEINPDSAFELVSPGRRLSDKQRSEIIQNLTFLTLGELINTDEGLFEINNLNKVELYERLKQQTLDDIGYKKDVLLEMIKDKEITEEQAAPKIAEVEDLLERVEEQWPQILDKFEEYINAYNISFDENNELQYNDEDKIRESDKYEATKIDSFKKAHAAIKLLLSTIPKVDQDGYNELSSIGGVVLLPSSVTYISIMNNVHDAIDVDDMMEKLRQMAIADPNYRKLYKRITKRDYAEPGSDFSKIDTMAAQQLLSAFWKTFKKQNPSVKNVFIFESGDVAVGDASLSTAANQFRSDYENAIIMKAKSGKGFYKYDKEKGAYVLNQDKFDRIHIGAYLSDIQEFLEELGIEFTMQDLKKIKGDKMVAFRDAVNGLKDSIGKKKQISSFSTKTLNISNRLLEMGLVKVAIGNNGQFDSTFFNVSRERTQSFIGPNAPSDLRDFLKNLTVFTEDSISGSQYSYLKSDNLSRNSNILKRMFASDGSRITTEEAKELLTVGYVSGVIDEKRGKAKPSAKLSFKERTVQEINLNLKGWFLNLVPGDVSMEWMIKMGIAVDVTNMTTGMKDINRIFKGYFLDEVDLSKEGRRIPDVKGRNTSDLRFFKDILDKETHDAIVTSEATAEELYELHQEQINLKLKEFIDGQNSKLQATLEKYGILKSTYGIYEWDGVSDFESMGKNELQRTLTGLTVNYMIANIELHKTLYSDPYQYSDELKRIKQFVSPRQSLMNGSAKLTSMLSNVWNKGYATNDIAFTDFTRGSFRTATHADVIGVIDLPGYTDFKATDGSGIILFRAHRQFRILAGEWNKQEERQYKYDMAWEKQHKSKGLTDRQIKGRGLVISAEERDILASGNPKVKSAYTPSKPIVAGNKANGKIYNDVILDKFALYPLSYRVMHDLNESVDQANSNTIALYDKMQKENIDYVVFESGRKVGAEELHPTYNPNGSFNNTPYKGIVNVPHSIISVQTDVPSKEDSELTRGSQVTKLVTMDYMEAGVPVDFMNDKSFEERYKQWYALTTDEERFVASPLFKEIKTNQYLLNALTEYGYKSLLKRLGITETFEDGERIFKVVNFEKAVKTLRDELLTREVNDNISDALTGFLKGKAVLEATPAYQQIRNILYSIADKEVISPKVTGGMKVQIPSDMLEQDRPKLVTINGKKGYVSDVLKFYSEERDVDGKRTKVNVCEIMIGRWFKSDMSDKDLLEYLNSSDEGQKILSGMAYRIPTQKQNSIDAFKVARFLPSEFGDSVVIPAALVQKAGSDFDIDKLSIYLKNVYIDSEGKPRLIPYFGIGPDALAKFSEMYDRGEFLSKSDKDKIQELIDKHNFELERDLEKSSNREILLKLLGGTFDQEYNQALLEEYLENTTNEEFKIKLINSFYKRSLENAYVQSSENLVTHPLNYERLIKPNSAEPLKDLADKVARLVKGEVFEYTSVGNMLDRQYMSSLRHAFITGKYAIGIAAVNQTNHSLNQRQPIYIDKTRLKALKEEDQHWLGDGEIKFQQYNRIRVEGRIVPTLSMVKNAEKSEQYPEGQDISDIIAMFIDGYVDISKGPWIMELGATPNVASTFLFLVKLGVPIDTVAYFMNQPIIRDYLGSIENAGYSWLFMDNFVTELLESEKYDAGKSNATANQIKKLPDTQTLKENLNKTEFTRDEKLYQRMILKEFLKYAKMAEHMFHVTQGSNFDTANFNDPYLIFKKMKQLEKAQNTIVSSVDELLSNSFVGNLGETLIKLRNALAMFLKSDQKRVRGIIQNVIEPYVDLPDREFVKVAQKAVNDLFDWAVQTNQTSTEGVPFNKIIKDILVKDGGVLKEVMEFVEKVRKDKTHPLFGNHIIDILDPKPSPAARPGGANNIKIKGQDNKVMDQNTIIYAFRELKENTEVIEKGLYEKIKLLSVLQSGLSTSPISFTAVLPYEDFEGMYNEVLSKLETLPNLENFYKLGVFQKNNWNNDDIVPNKRATRVYSKKTDEWYYNLSMTALDENVKNAVSQGAIPPVMTQSANNKEANFDYMVYSWELGAELLTPEEIADRTTPLDVKIARRKSVMRADGDFSYVRKGLFKKVYFNNGTPLTTKDRGEREYFVYKAVNAWGDSYRANEFYTADQQSVLENGFFKVDVVDDNAVIDVFLKRKTFSTGNVGGVAEIKSIKYALKDGNEYAIEDIDVTLLEKLGYNASTIGAILKTINKC